MKLGILVAGVCVLLLAEGLMLPTAWLPVEEAAVLAPARGNGLDAPSAGVLAQGLLAPVAQTLAPREAYRLAQALSALLWGLAAVPAFLLARRFVPPGAALVSGGLAVLVPGALYATAAVPDALAFFLAVSSLALVVRQNLPAAVALAAAAALARPWLVVLPFAVLAGNELLRTGRLDSLRWPRPLAFAPAAAIAYLALARFAPDAALAVVSPGAVLRAGAASLAAAILGAGVVPWLLAAASHRPERMLLAASLPPLALTAGALGAVAPGRGLDERPLLLLSPLVFALAAAALVERTARLRPAVAAAAAVVVAAVALPALARPAEGRALGLALVAPEGGSRPLLAASVAVAATVGLLLVHALRRRRLLLVAVAAAVVAAGHATAWRSVHEEALELAAAEPAPRDWVDRAAGPGEHVVIAGPPPALDVLLVAQLSLWNGAVRGVQALDPVRPDAESGQFGIDPAAPLVLALGPELAGEEIDRRGAAALLRPEAQYRLAETVEGLEPDGWTGERVVYRRFSAAPGTLRITLTRVNAPEHAPPAEIAISSGSLDADADEERARFVLAPGEERAVELEIPRARWQVVVTVRPTFPAPDGRELGAQAGFSYRRGP